MNTIGNPARPRWRVLAGLLALVLAAPAGGEVSQVLSSGPARTVLLELYTSEGCSSCPAADWWLSRFRTDPRLWREVVPVAFHVDYWDHLGWPDRLAAAEHTARQRRYRELGALRQVYTPAFVVHGREWRGWFSRPKLERQERVPAGHLTVERRGAELRARFSAGETADGALRLHVALLGFGLETEVRGGENEGRKLVHDFAVLGRAEAALRRDAGAWVGLTALPESSARTERRGIAAWVSRADDPRPIQAVGGWLTAP